jgi:hypothetical protein
VDSASEGPLAAILAGFTRLGSRVVYASGAWIVELARLPLQRRFRNGSIRRHVLDGSSSLSLIAKTCNKFTA